MAKGVRKNITVPGLLAPALRLRFREFGFCTLSPFVVNLAAYDLQRGARHTISVAIAYETQAAQDAVDAVLVASYEPGAPRDKGLLVQLVQDMEKARSLAHRTKAIETLSAVPERVTFPERLWKLVDVRWSELGYPCLSGYVTGLIRYNLMLGGTFPLLMPTTQRRAQRALSRETAKLRQQGEVRKTYLDHLIQEAEGRPLGDDELEKIKAKIARHLPTIMHRSSKSDCTSSAMQFPAPDDAAAAEPPKEIPFSPLSRQRAD
jgi:hypothetical protein